MYFWGFSIIISPIEQQKTEYTHTASRVHRSIFRDGPPGNWHTEGVPTGAPANARRRSWASMASFQASLTIQYFSTEMIDQRVFVIMMASMNYFTPSKVAFWCWGTLWSPPAIGWGTLWSPPAMGSRRACTTSDSRDMLMADLWRLSNGGTMAANECRRFGSRVQAMTVSARLPCFGSGTLVVRNVSSRRAWSGCRTSCQISNSSCSISDDRVDTPAASLWWLLISQSVLSSSSFIWTVAQTLAIILESSVGSWDIWLAMKIGCLLQCTCKCSLKVCFLILLWIVIPHLASRRFHDWWSEVGHVERSI